MTKLSVNINKVALIRNAREGNFPDLRQVAMDCQKFGADGITVHPRPDERHIRYSDIPVLKEVVTTEFNIEGYPNEKFLELVEKYKPHQCTLVPDPPGILTSNEGWDTKKDVAMLKEVVNKLQSKGIRVSLFLDPIEERVEEAKEIGADRIELYTGDYAKTYLSDKEGAIENHIKCSKLAGTLGLGLNAGHDLNLENLAYYKQNVQDLLEVSIGHALISDALYFGLKNAIQLYQRALS